MLEALRADGPFPNYADKLMLFGQFVGVWDIDARFFERDRGLVREGRAEWLFGWALEGRVVQDVLISPPRAGRKPGQTSKEYGSTIRAYDPEIDGWRVTFVAPVYGATVTLIARAQGNEIWLDGRAPNNDLFHWTFSEITPDSFRWRGHESSDEGRSWFMGEEMIARRHQTWPIVSAAVFASSAACASLA
jgi:hypothetical protein